MSDAQQATAPITPQERARSKTKTASTPKQVIPAPDRPKRLPPYPSGDGAKLTNPDVVWEYRQPDGALYALVARWNATAEREKIVRPCVWDGTRWRWAGLSALPRPLYGAHTITPDTHTILAVEGEKAADAAAEYASEGWAVVTWQGGGGAAHLTDWSPVAGRDVVIWPDADDPGARVAAQVHDLALKAGGRPAIVALPEDMPDKWDLADPLPPTLPAPVYIRQLLSEAQSRCAVTHHAPDTLSAPEEPQEQAREPSEPSPYSNGHDAPPGPPPGPADEENPAEEVAVGDPLNVDAERMFEPLGYNDGMFYIISSKAQQVQAFNAQQIVGRPGLLSLAPYTFWRTRWASADGNSTIPWHVEGSHLMEACYQKGVFSPDKIRGVGAWLDEQRVVVHCGDSLLVNNQTVSPSAFNSKFIYPRLRQTFDLSSLQPLTDAEARKLLSVCRMPKWSRPFYGDLLAGWIATAMVCGSLRWRTHVWLTGTAGAGKSWLVENLIGGTLGDVGLYVAGKTTAAGIMQTIKRDARPVVFDESEGSDGSAAKTRRDEILELLRTSSSDTRASQVKGSSHHEAVAFQMRCQFLLSSVEVALRKRADERRNVVLTLTGSDGYTDDQKQAREAHFAALQAAVSNMPPNLPERLFLRMVRLIPTVRQNMETFSEAFAVVVGGRPIGDQLGALLAGTYALVNSVPISKDAARSYVEQRDWTEFTENLDSPEHRDVLDYLLDQKVTVSANNGSRIEKSVGELIALALGRSVGDKVSREEADLALRRIGMRAVKGRQTIGDGEAPVDGVWFANEHPGLDGLMEKSAYPQGYSRLLARDPTAKSSANGIRFSGRLRRAVFLPASSVLEEGEDDAGESNEVIPF